MPSKYLYSAAQAPMSFGKGGSQPPEPTRVSDNLRSQDTVEVLLGLGEGPWSKLHDGLKSFYIANTPLMASDGTLNFPEANLIFHKGTAMPDPVKFLLGGSASGHAVGVNLAQNSAVTRTTTSGAIDAIDVRLRIDQLMLNTEDGDLLNEDLLFRVEVKPTSSGTWTNLPSNTGWLQSWTAPEEDDDASGIWASLRHRIIELQTEDALTEYQAEVQAWQEYQDNADGPIDASLGVQAYSENIRIYGRTQSPVMKEIRIPVTRLTNDTYDIRVTKISAESTSTSVREITWDTFEQITIEEKSYPNTVMAQLVVQASDQLSNVPQMYGIYDTAEILVPSIFDPITRSYDFSGGPWDGTFKVAFTDDLAWIIYDLVHNDVHGIAAYHAINFSKYEALEASLYWNACDPVTGAYVGVPRPSGGTRPRVTFNGLIDSPRNSMELLTYMAGAGNAVFYEDVEGNFRLKVETDTPATQTFNNMDVENGRFQYSFSDVNTRYNDITVVYRNKKLPAYEEDRRRVYDQADIDANGRKPLTFVAVGCVDTDEAITRAYHKLITSLTETRNVAFTTTRMGAYVEPHDIILIADEAMDEGYSRRSLGVSADRRTITYNEPLALESGINDYVVRIQTTDGIWEGQVGESSVYTTENTIRLVSADAIPQTILDSLDPNFSFSVASATEGDLRPYRVTSIEEGDGDEKIKISAIEVNRAKYSLIDNFDGEIFNVANETDESDSPSRLVQDLQATVTERSTIDGKVRDINLSWDSPETTTAGAVYSIRYSLNDEESYEITRGTNRSYILKDVDIGRHTFAVTTLQGNGSDSPETRRIRVTTVAPDYGLPSITGVTIQNKKDSSTSYIGRNVSVEWSVDTSDQWAGWASDKPHPDFAWWEVDVVNPSNGAIVHTYQVNDWKTKKLEIPYSDFNTFGLTNIRDFSLVVSMSDADGNEGGSVSQSVQKPLNSLQGVNFTQPEGFSSRTSMKYTPVTDVDFKGVKVWVSNSANAHTSGVLAWTGEGTPVFDVQQGLNHIAYQPLDVLGGGTLVHTTFDVSITNIEQALEDAENSLDAIEQTLADTQSQVSQDAAAAAAARDAAELAETNAETAQTAAEAARDQANTILGTTQNARDAAQLAETNAETAQTAAETAKAQTDTILSNVQTLEGQTQTAKTAAETAQAVSETAKIAAETAETAAETAQGLAEDAKTAAQNFANNSATSATASETSKIAAEAVQSDLEASDKYSELFRVTPSTDDWVDQNGHTHSIANNVITMSSTAGVTQGGDAGSTTNGVYVKIPTDIEREITGKNIKLVFEMEAPVSNASSNVGIAYSTASVGNSQWQVHPVPATGVFELELPYSVGSGNTLTYDAIGIIGDADGNGGEVNVHSVKLYVQGSYIELSGAATAAATAERSSFAAAKASESEQFSIAAETAKVSAETAESNASSSETAAAQSATDAAGSESAAATSATNAAQSETQAGNSASAAATSASTASTKATEASQSASAANTAKLGAETAKSAAESAETNAVSAKNDAESAESAAATSATNAAQSATDAGNSASAAATSASTASTKATEASQSASAANTAKLAAETAESGAQSAETNAVSAKNDAESAESAAATSATNAAQSQTQAGNSASAAATSASTASTKATEASQSASAANTAKLAAETAEGNASASETAAATSASNAAGSASSASSSETVAAEAAGDAIETVMLSGPTKADNINYFTSSGYVAPTAAPNTVWDVETHATYGTYLEGPAGTNNTLSPKAMFRHDPDKIYEITYRYFGIDDGDTQIPCWNYLGITSADGAYAVVGNNRQIANTSQVSDGLISRSILVGGSNIPSSDVNIVLGSAAVWVRPQIRQNAGNTSNGQIGVVEITVEDVTARIASAASAAASSTSAAAALVSETAAGQEAAAATTAKNQAVTAQGQASTSASSAAQSATDANDSANSASNSQTAAANSATQAGNSAGAAATSASSAASEATNAAQSASSAQTSANTANTAAGNASTSATAAASSATNAAGSANTASISEGVVTSASNAALYEAIQLFPETMVDAGKYWTHSLTGLDGQQSSIVTSLGSNSLVTDVDRGEVLSISATGGNRHIAPKGRFVPYDGMVVRLTWEAKYVGATPPAAAVFSAQVRALNASGASNGTTGGGGKAFTVGADIWETFTVDIPPNTAVTANPYAYGFIYTNPNHNISGDSILISHLRIEDVTQQVAAETSATSAATSATSAASSAIDADGSRSQAASSATAAANSATQSGNSAGAAATSASVAASEATDAGQQAAAAQSSAVTAELNQNAAVTKNIVRTINGTNGAGEWTNASTSTSVPSVAPSGALSLQIGDSREHPNYTSLIEGRYYKVSGWFNTQGCTSTPWFGIRGTLSSGTNYSKNISGLLTANQDWFYHEGTPVLVTGVTTGVTWGAGSNTNNSEILLAYEVRLEDVTEQVLAGQQASAAATSASSAAASETAAGQSASAANSSQLAAETAKAGAEASQSSSAASATSAAGSASTATTQANLAVDASSAAELSVQRTRPSTMEDGGKNFVYHWAHTAPDSTHTATESTNVEAGNDNNGYYIKNLGLGIQQLIYQKTGVPAVPNHRYRVSALIEPTVAGKLAYLRIRNTAGDYASTYGFYQSRAQTVTAGLNEYVADFTLTQAKYDEGTRHMVAEIILAQNQGSQHKLYKLDIQDITSEYQAEQSASAAATSATTANASANTASSQASIATTERIAAESARDNAAGSASASAASASNANTFADNASNSATAAQNSATAAGSSASSAGVYAGNAANSATDAQVSASAAATSESVTAQTYTNTLASLNENTWNDFPVKETWTQQVSGTPAGKSDLSGSVNAEGWYGASGATFSIGPKHWFDPDRIYEATADVEIDSDSNGLSNIQIGVYALDSEGNTVDSNSGLILQNTANRGVGRRTYTRRFTAGSVVPAGVVQHTDHAIAERLVILTGWRNGGTTVGKVHSLKIRDVTQEALAEVQATAAATSASTAATQASNAGSSASSATTQANNAATSAAQAGTSATTAAAAATDANGSAIAAAAYARESINASTGRNLLKNTRFLWDDGSWYSSGGPAFVRTFREDNEYNIEGERAYEIRQTGGANTGYNDSRSERLSIEQGKTYVASVYSAAHRCNVEIRIEWRNSNDTIVGYSYGNNGVNLNQAQNLATHSGGNTLAGYKRIWSIGAAPSTARYANVHVRKHATNVGRTSSYMFLTRPQFAEGNLGQTEAGPWSEGSSEVEVSTMAAALIDENGNMGAYWQKELSVNGFTGAFISARTTESNGVASSDVSFGAREIGLYNIVDATWLQAMRVSGGNVRISGNLEAGAGIYLGTGSGRWPVALQDRLYNETDGTAITFGTNVDIGDYDVDFSTIGLDELSSGESYRLRPINQTGTGFTAELKITTTGATTSVTASTNATSPAGPAHMVAKADTEAYNDTYAFFISGTVSVSAFDEGGLEVGDINFVEYWGSITVQTWFHDGTSWVQGPTKVLNYWDLGINPTHTNGNQNYSFSNKVFSVSHTGTIRTSASLGTFGVTKTSSLGSLTDLNKVTYVKQGQSGTRSATPNGELCRITVKPRNQSS